MAYHAAEVMVLPSDREPWGWLYRGQWPPDYPVIATDVVGAAKELVKDGDSGRLFDDR